MNHCLDIHELLEVIFEFVDEPRTLSALALTCKSFTELAVDLLWARWGNIFELVRRMPGDLWGERYNHHKVLVCPLYNTTPVLLLITLNST